jgi:hypothetical protein
VRCALKHEKLCVDGQVWLALPQKNNITFGTINIGAGTGVVKRAGGLDGYVGSYDELGRGRFSRYCNCGNRANIAADAQKKALE